MIATAPVPRTGRCHTAVAARGEALLQGLGVFAQRDPAELADRIQPDGPDPFSSRLRSGLMILLAAVHSRELRLAAAANRSLVGAGPGLTPLGDDYLVGSALAVTALGGATNFPERARERWLEALLPADSGLRTTPLSARLLEMARGGRGASPLRGVLDLSSEGEAQLEPSLGRLIAIGASTGRGCAAAIGASALLLAAEANSPEQSTAPKGNSCKT